MTFRDANLSFCGGHTLLDPRGTDLPDAEAAVQHGNQLARGFVHTVRVLNGEGVRSTWHVQVTDEDGHTLGRFEVPEQ